MSPENVDAAAQEPSEEGLSNDSLQEAVWFIRGKGGGWFPRHRGPLHFLRCLCLGGCFRVRYVRFLFVLKAICSGNNTLLHPLLLNVSACTLVHVLLLLGCGLFYFS